MKDHFAFCQMKKFLLLALFNKIPLEISETIVYNIISTVHKRLLPYNTELYGNYAIFCKEE